MVNEQRRTQNTVRATANRFEGVARYLDQPNASHAAHRSLMIWRVVAFMPNEQTRIIGPITQRATLHETCDALAKQGYALVIQRARWDAIATVDPTETGIADAVASRRPMP